MIRDQKCLVATSESMDRDHFMRGLVSMLQNADSCIGEGETIEWVLANDQICL